MLLLDKQRAKPRLSILHSRCPALEVICYLQQHGWTPADGRIVHSSSVHCLYDGKEAMAMKRYLQVVAKIERPLTLCPGIPSRQPVHFYQLLLDGVQTSPGLPSKAYGALIKLHGKGEDVEELSIEDDV